MWDEGNAVVKKLGRIAGRRAWSRRGAGGGCPHIGLWVLATVIVLTTLCAFAASGQKITSAKAVEDLPAGAMQAKATTACLECHEARIILQQRLGKAAWSREVDKMIKWGAVVDASDRDGLIDYLSTNFPPDLPPYEAPRSAAQKNGAGKAK